MPPAAHSKQLKSPSLPSAVVLCPDVFLSTPSKQLQCQAKPMQSRQPQVLSVECWASSQRISSASRKLYYLKASVFFDCLLGPLSFLSHFIDVCLSLSVFSSLFLCSFFFNLLFFLHSHTNHDENTNFMFALLKLVKSAAQELKGLDLNQTEHMMEDNDDAVFCGLCSFACLGVLRACMFLGLWSARLAKAQAHEFQVALFFP